MGRCPHHPQITDYMSVLLRLRRTVAHGRIEFSSLNHTNKSHTSKDVWLLLAQKERLEKGCAFFICSANNRLYVRAPPPAANRRTWTNRVLVLLPNFWKMFQNKFTQRSRDVKLFYILLCGVDRSN